MPPSPVTFHTEDEVQYYSPTESTEFTPAHPRQRMASAFLPFHRRRRNSVRGPAPHLAPDAGSSPRHGI